MTYFFLIWALIGYYCSYRSLKYGVLRKFEHLDIADLVVHIIIFPLMGPVSFLFAWSELGFPSVKIKNPFYKE